MPVLITADLHLSDNPRDWYRHTWLNDFQAEAKERKADAICILGDLTEEKDRHSAGLVNAVVEGLHALSTVCPLIVLRGNHDYIDLNSPFYAFLKFIPNITWINGPLDVDLPGLGTCLFLPHTNRPKEDWGEYNMEGYAAIFAHNTFDGTDMGGGRIAAGATSTDWFPEDALVIAGDVHIPQTNGPITYVGAPYTVDFGDDYKARYLVLSRDRGSIRVGSVPCTGPQKRLVTLEAGQKGAAKALDAAGVNKGDILKIRIRLKPENVPKWGEIQKWIKDWGVRNRVVIHTIQPVVSAGSEAQPIAQTMKKVDDAGLIREHASRASIDETTLRTGLRLAGLE